MEEANLFCNKGRKIRKTLCIQGENLENITNDISKLGDSNGHTLISINERVKTLCKK